MAWRQVETPSLKKEVNEVKKIIVLSMAVVLILGSINLAFAEEWYRVLFRGPDEQKCENVSEYSLNIYKTPADIIKSYKKAGKPYSLKNQKTVDGKVVQLTFIDDEHPEFSIIFFYGLGRCKAYFDAAKKQRQREEKEIEEKYGK